LGEHRPGQDHERRLTLAEASEILGISKDGVRMRVRRGTLPSEKGEDGKVFVFVDNMDNDQDDVPPVTLPQVPPIPQGSWSRSSGPRLRI
jgi:hypothetical protein